MAALVARVSFLRASRHGDSVTIAAMILRLLYHTRLGLIAVVSVIVISFALTAVCPTIGSWLLISVLMVVAVTRQLARSTLESEIDKALPEVMAAVLESRPATSDCVDAQHCSSRALTH